MYVFNLSFFKNIHWMWRLCIAFLIVYSWCEIFRDVESTFKSGDLNESVRRLEWNSEKL